MRKHFPGYYRPSETEFARMWQDGLFVLDASFLLDLFRYSDETANSLLETLEKIAHRIWIPHQAALEYHRNLNSVVEQAAQSYADSLALLQKLIDQLKSDKRGHPFLDPKFHKEIQPVFSNLQAALQKKQKEIRSLLTTNPIKNRLAELLDGKVGDPFSETEFQEICTEGEKRFKRRIPPGFSDAKKPENEKYGDLVLWKQILVKAKDTEVAIVFVTADAKEDWFLLTSEKTIIGPHPQLTAELKEIRDILLYIYPTHSFLKYSEKHLAVRVRRQALDEVRHLEDEKIRKREQINLSSTGLDALKTVAPTLHGLLTKTSPSSSSQAISFSPETLARVRSLELSSPGAVADIARYLGWTNVSSLHPDVRSLGLLGPLLLEVTRTSSEDLGHETPTLAFDLSPPERTPPAIPEEEEHQEDSEGPSDEPKNE